MKKLFLALVAGATLFLAGCGIDGGQLVRDGVPTGQILLINASSSTLTAVTVSTCDAMSHGFNRLPSGVQLRPGDSYPFTVSAGCYDVQAGYGWSTGYAWADFNDIYVPAGRQYTLRVN